MDDKFYVLGGVGVDKTTQLTCGEEFDLKTRKWRKIPNMCPSRHGGDGVIETPTNGEAPPLVAVVNNVLYVADYASQEVKRYVKNINSWVTIGRLLERVTSVNGWGVAFRACGDKLVVIGSPSIHGETVTKVNAWVVDEGTSQ
uniref:F-box/kelch-repeat protein SKIP11 n=2 Tax=Cicer arietinum TaxID=3827 RepID=A0A1S3ECM3_CICAR|nr:F-box/kelch-repeat protein SKIP11 [Cicer arietinum]